MMDISYDPYKFDSHVELLIERMHAPRVCIDNDSCPYSTLVKINRANKDGILLEMVQVLTDLDLMIYKSYISTDGSWVMDVFHVMDQRGNKITNEGLIHYIQQAISSCTEKSMVAKPWICKDVRPSHVLTGYTTLEMTGIDRPGLMSEMSAVLAELGCHVSAAMVWTHNNRVACIIHVEDKPESGSISDPFRLAYIQFWLEKVVEAHHRKGERRSVRFATPATGQTHTERRLHQLLLADRDFEACVPCCPNEEDEFLIYNMKQRKICKGTHVKIENCEERSYSIVQVRSRDRPKLLFDTLCALTDMQYVVFHAAISSKCSIAVQEYYVRHKDGYTRETQAERERIAQCLIAAIERRVSHGVRLDISIDNRVGLLSNVTRIFRENGLSITRAEIGTSGHKAVGTFYIKDVSEQSVSTKTLEMIQHEIRGTIVVNKSLDRSQPGTSSLSTTSKHNSNGTGIGIGERPKFSLRNFFWSLLQRFLCSFRPIN